MDSESQRNLLRNLADITSTGYSSAYDKAQTQFNTEEDRRRAAQQDANVYGLRALDQMRDFGDIERAIEAEGIAADYAQFKEERDDPYKKVQYQQSLLQGLPIDAQTRDYVEQSGLSEILSQIGAAGEAGSKWSNFMAAWECTGENEGKTRNIFGFCV